mmetsp:Transcript_84912/g.166155  ORF Transcript_84912/g.166155 Transcript_84912/m.166155 type:complete len:219 (-) Transcript_84912:44-700(-)
MLQPWWATRCSHNGSQSPLDALSRSERSSGMSADAARLLPRGAKLARVCSPSPTASTSIGTALLSPASSASMPCMAPAATASGMLASAAAAATVLLPLPSLLRPPPTLRGEGNCVASFGTARGSTGAGKSAATSECSMSAAAKPTSPGEFGSGAGNSVRSSTLLQARLLHVLVLPHVLSPARVLPLQESSSQVASSSAPVTSGKVSMCSVRCGCRGDG